MMGPFEATLRMLVRGGPPEVVAQTNVEGAETRFVTAVSTIDTEEGYGYETALRVRDSWHPVERYETREAAVAGHANWVAAAPTLTQVVDIGLPSLGSVKTIISAE